MTAFRRGPAASTTPTTAEGSSGGCRIFDIVLFNPPYVPTSDQELEQAYAGGSTGDDWIIASWAGGPLGTVVLDRFLQQLPHVLAPSGRAYVLVFAANKGSVGREQLEALGLVADVVLARRTGTERLEVLRITHITTAAPQINGELGS